jgi:hypothetical protein
LRLAIVHDWLTGMRGGEKALEVLCERHPHAELFTLLHVPGSVSPTIERRPIHTSFVQHLPLVRQLYRHYLPLFPTAVEQFNFDGLVSRFDSALVANPSLTSWSLSQALLDFHLGGSDDAALGGDLAYEYGKNGNLSNVGSTGAQNVLGSAQFGSAPQTFQSLVVVRQSFRFDGTLHESVPVGVA